MNTRTTIALSAFAGAALILTVAAASAPDTTAPAADTTVSAPSNWRDNYVPCDTPSADTMVVGCYWDQGDKPYIVTDDGEMFYIDDATGERTYVESGDEPWNAGIVNEDPTIQHFEDGSWLSSDGTSGCDAGAPCDQLPPIPDTAVPSGNGGYLPNMVLPPCHVEDAEYNCYWDAARQGNGIGHSFIVWDGAVYYAG